MMSFAVDEVSNKDDEGRARLGITYDVQIQMNAFKKEDHQI